MDNVLSVSLKRLLQFFWFLNSNGIRMEIVFFFVKLVIYNNDQFFLYFGSSKSVIVQKTQTESFPINTGIKYISLRVPLRTCFHLPKTLDTDRKGEYRGIGQQKIWPPTSAEKKVIVFGGKKVGRIVFFFSHYFFSPKSFLPVFAIDWQMWKVHFKIIDNVYTGLRNHMRIVFERCRLGHL